jgi:nucleotide-binding universal stress UspA family protein
VRRKIAVRALKFLPRINDKGEAMKILIAVDGSKCSQKAASECCRLIAGRPDTQVRVVSVCEVFYPVAGETFAVPAGFYQDFQEDLRKQAVNVATEAAEQLLGACAETPPAVDSEILIDSPVREIIEAARR